MSMHVQSQYTTTLPIESSSRNKSIWMLSLSSQIIGARTASADSWEDADADCIGESAIGGEHGSGRGEPGSGAADADTSEATGSGTVGIGTSAGGNAASRSVVFSRSPSCNPQLCYHAHTVQAIPM